MGDKDKELEKGYEALREHQENLIEEHEERRTEEEKREEAHDEATKSPLSTDD